MTSFDPGSSRREGEATSGSARAEPFTIADCKSCEPELREALETLDDEVRAIVNQLLAGAESRGADGTSFLKAATTVLLSIAASLLETAAVRGCEPVEVEAFKDAAEDAAQWAKSHRLRDLLDSED
ncbi:MULTISPECIES: hypothetical protein [Methylosinus]|uniref:Uncharacterized protein n=1 Tax=Methylosinus trichosporium (strain ATCC 35070 / NCIMB 11131 / UNIQEM 75 / OB3b) TaxID=595536 RepID=A0A2D2D4D5_METT3|nr:MULTISPECIES: hypothetical protein [Methylosinus]ATQ69843.1 hypothetical protein CQW49_19615 [Methylosinus trichosporium OB3b]OBS52357.1 hypothetical protein A8B73_10850 [Methylosinus sp. 3S-1]